MKELSTVDGMASCCHAFIHGRYVILQSHHVSESRALQATPKTYLQALEATFVLLSISDLGTQPAGKVAIQEKVSWLDSW